MMYIVVAVTAVSTLLVTVLFNSLHFVQPSNTRNCTDNDSSTFRRGHLTRQVPSVCSDQHFKRPQDRYCFDSPMSSNTPAAPATARKSYATPEIVRSSELGPATIRSNVREQLSVDRTALASPALARNSDVGSSTRLDNERSNVKQPTTDRSEIPTPVMARSGLVPPSTVRIQEANNNLVETQKRAEKNIAANGTINSTKETGLLTFTKESDNSSTEAGGFAARRTFSGSGSDVWLEFIRYFENLMALNNWSLEKARRIFLCLLRGQAESFAYGLPLEVQSNWASLKAHMEERFGLFAMRDSYIAEAKLRRKKSDENFRDFGQAVESLFRRAYPGNMDVIRENALTTFLENCSNTADFRMAVKRTKPQTLQEAVKNAIQEECIRLGESEKKAANKPNKPVFDLSKNNKATFGRYHRSRRPWSYREAEAGRNLSKRDKSFDEHKSSSEKQGSSTDTSNKDETIDQPRIEQEPLN